MVLYSLLCCLFWTVTLVVVAYPIAFFSSVFYIALQPFQICCHPCLIVAQMFFRLVQLPLSCAEKARGSFCTEEDTRRNSTNTNNSIHLPRVHVTEDIENKNIEEL